MVRLGFDTVEPEYLLGCVAGSNVTLTPLLVLTHDTLVAVGTAVTLHGIVMGSPKLTLYVLCGMETDGVPKV